MLKKRTAEQLNTQTMLYRVVFDTTMVKYAVAILFGFLLLQPVSPAFAFVDGLVSDTSSDSASVESVSDDTQEELVEQSVQTDEAPVSEDDGSQTVNQENTEVPATTNTPSEEVIESNEVTEPIVDDTALTTSTDEGTVVDESSSAVDEEVVLPQSTTTQETVPITEEIVEPIEEEALATTSEEIATSTQEEVVFVAGNSSAFEFDTKECASVGDGAYYCSSVEEVVDPLKDGIFSAPDIDGDLEIYVRLGGEENVITSNNVDDTAPYYDALGERIVWHRMVNDRYQIVSYDLTSNAETVLTNTNYNNMEPVAYEGMTLWQAWVGNNWEIMMFDGTQTAQLTNNTVQDVSPHMRGGYIVWQTQFKEGWQVAVYDQQTKAIEYIASEGGIKVENPRFVLVYDSTNVQGDIQTVGYDFENKESFTLARVPVELPDELPDPDQTGETRALIQNKQTSREGESEMLDIISNSQTSSSTASSTSSNIHTLDLSTPLSSTTASTTVIDITDVVIPSYTGSTTSSQPIIEQNDIVIPPFTASSTELVG